MKQTTDLVGYIATVILGVCVIALAAKDSETQNDIRALKIENSDRLAEIATLQSEKASRAELMRTQMDLLDLQQKVTALEKKENQ